MATTNININPRPLPSAPLKQFVIRGIAFTYQDAINHLLDFLGADVGAEALRTARRAIQNTLRTFPRMHRWSYYYNHGRINTNGSYSTGTVSYDFTGGAYERMLVLTGGTFPAWASEGTVRINDANYKIASVVSSTIAMLDSAQSPREDLPAGTKFVIFCDEYLLPLEFISADEGLNKSNFTNMSYVHPREWLSNVENGNNYSSDPYMYTITGHSTLQGRLSFRVYPFPSTSKSFDFLYQKGARQVAVELYTAGTVAANTSNGPTTTITATGANFTSSLTGSIIRVSADSSDFPTGLDGDNIAEYERQIVGVVSSSQIIVDEPIYATFTARKYSISDPIDIEQGVMLDPFLRGCEYQVSLLRSKANAPDLYQLYMTSVKQAQAADSKVIQRRSASPDTYIRPRLASFPLGGNIG
jgi:hypothetical protein